jgi:hypothetical protein
LFVNDAYQKVWGLSKKTLWESVLIFRGCSSRG